MNVQSAQIILITIKETMIIKVYVKFILHAFQYVKRNCKSNNTQTFYKRLY